MTAKSYWLNKIYHESQEGFKTTPLNISWSTSDCDDDDDDTNNIPQNNKKKSICSNTVETNWRKSDLQIESNNYVVDVIEKNIDSPIISAMMSEEMSPILTQISDNIELTDETSPVLGQRGVLKRVRSKYKEQVQVKKQILVSPASSPDIFKTQLTRIIEGDSPESNKKIDTLAFTPENSQSTECIDDFPSQCGSEVKNSDFDSYHFKLYMDSLYHQPPARKKNFKKGTLAFHLQKALCLQRTRVSIWQHEIYTKKAEYFMDIGEVIKFTIKNEQKEYGCILLECQVLDKTLVNYTNAIPLSNIVEEERCFLVIIGFSVNLNIVFQIDCTYKLFPPYSSQRILRNSKYYLCYYNVSKILCEN